MRYVHIISRDTEIVLCRQKTLDYGLDSVFLYKTLLAIHI